MCELPHNIMIENIVIEVDMLDNYFVLLGKDNIFENNASVRETGNGLIFMTGRFTISLIWSKNSYLILIVEMEMVHSLVMAIQLFSHLNL